ncbi:predicted protein [Lichtheimia corymbifera JMRC:FSU:9682]|uniref:Uncharacterized protein n=1 Tax=Lichtheimia corymbifera JMRC:FSU:9682 TaxID=1263082 RepID=A0A068RRU1_9FUNG|nr:predicted protein [Lichtheimia corymbifera JMRC:FSU:9682]
MDGIKCGDEESWNVALVTWQVVSRNYGWYHVDTAEDNDGLDGVVEWAFIFDERRFAGMDNIRMLDQETHSN